MARWAFLAQQMDCNCIRSMQKFQPLNTSKEGSKEECQLGKASNNFFSSNERPANRELQQLVDMNLSNKFDHHGQQQIITVQQLFSTIQQLDWSTTPATDHVMCKAHSNASRE
ncbi:hypothetical protein ACLOJK_027047 [Asimina triloba]